MADNTTPVNHNTTPNNTFNMADQQLVLGRSVLDNPEINEPQEPQEPQEPEAQEPQEPETPEVPKSLEEDKDMEQFVQALDAVMKYIVQALTKVMDNHHQEREGMAQLIENVTVDFYEFTLQDHREERVFVLVQTFLLLFAILVAMFLVLSKYQATT